MLWRIVVPLMLPSIAVVVLLGLIRSMQAFEIELILGYPAKIDVYSTAIYWAINSQPPGYGVASVLAVTFLAAIAPIVIVQQWYTAGRGHATVGGKFSARPHDLRWRGGGSFAAIVVLLFFMTVLPFALLLMGSFMKQFGMFDLPQPWTLRNWTEALTRGDIPRAFWNSIRLASAAAVIGMMLYSLLAYMIVKTPLSRAARVGFPDLAAGGDPGLVLGLGYLQMFRHAAVPADLRHDRHAGHRRGCRRRSLGTQIIKTSLLRLGSELKKPR